MAGLFDTSSCIFSKETLVRFEVIQIGGVSHIPLVSKLINSSESIGRSRITYHEDEIV